MKTLLLGPVIVRRQLQEASEAQGRVLLDLRPEFHLGRHGIDRMGPSYLPVAIQGAFQDAWEAQGLNAFGGLCDDALQDRQNFSISIASIKSDAALFPSRALAFKILADASLDPEIVDEITYIFSRRLRGMFGALAYQCAALGEKRVVVGCMGRFEPQIQREIIRRIPFDIYKAGEIFNELYIEMASLVRFRGIKKVWGEVIEKEGDVWIEINPNLPEFVEHF